MTSGIIRDNYPILLLLPYTKILAGFIVDDTASLVTIEVSWTNNEIRNIEGKETIEIEAAWISLRQHESLADNAIGIDMTEIGSCKETIITT